MTTRLLPSDFDASLNLAVKTFWANRGRAQGKQEGARGSVTGGKNLDGFLTIVRDIAKHCGIAESSVFTDGRKHLTIPGYYRPTKNWDVVIVDRHRLLAALEFKSQVGSFGNNFNNRAEEAIGSASDLWMAAQHGIYQPSNHTKTSDLPDDPRPPFLGYLMLLEDCEGSTKPVQVDALHYRVSAEFDDASYARRYQILCERLMEQRLYKAAALMLTAPDSGGQTGAHRALSEATSVKNLFVELAGQLLAAAEL